MYNCGKANKEYYGTIFTISPSQGEKSHESRPAKVADV